MYSILHLEPSELIRKMVGDHLVEKGFDYIPVNTAQDAYNILQRLPINLIVTSMLIPDETIENFLRKVNEGMNSHTPVFVVTSTSLGEDKKGIINLGISDYISKDNLLQEIIKHIEVVSQEDILMKYLRDFQIAVIDDVKFDREIIKSILDKYEINKVDYYDSGEKLLEKEKVYDLYLVDAVLKDEFGKNVVMQIRRNNLDASIVIVSSLTNPKTLASLLHAGANDYITKPIDEDIFIAKLKSHVRFHVLLKKA